MIWIIFVGLAGLAVLFHILDDDYVSGWLIGSVISAIAACVIFVIAIITTIVVVDAQTADERIAMYEYENQKIEKQITEIVENYQEYEKGIFAEVNEENAMALITLYPDLKSDSLVKEQISVYVENNEKIKKLKEEKISVRPYKWWLYFGS